MSTLWRGLGLSDVNGQFLGPQSIDKAVHALSMPVGP